MSNVTHKRIEFDPEDMVPLAGIGASMGSFAILLTVLGYIMQLPAPIGPVLLVTGIVSSTLITTVAVWIRERRKYLRKIRSALNLKAEDKVPYIPVIPFRSSKDFEFDGNKSQRVSRGATSEFNIVYSASSKNFHAINLPDLSPPAVWDKILDKVDVSYSITGRRS